MGERGEYMPVGGRSTDLLKKLWSQQTKQAPDIGALLEAGKTVRWWSDPHFSHENIIRMCNRPFTDVAEMDKTMMTNVQTAFSQSDLVVCVGDLAMYKADHIQSRLYDAYGDKHLMLVGNHDAKGTKPHGWLKTGAQASLAFSLPINLIKDWMDTDNLELSQCLDWQRLPHRIYFGMAHWPIPASRMPKGVWVNIHGHIHNRPAAPLHINTSMEGISYQPKLLRELITPELISDLIRHTYDPTHFVQLAASLEKKQPHDY